MRGSGTGNRLSETHSQAHSEALSEAPEGARRDVVFARDIAERVAYFTPRGGEDRGTGAVLPGAAGPELARTRALVHDGMTAGSPPANPHRDPPHPERLRAAGRGSGR
ncbi:hypothetical protein ACFUN8_18365 [Streptomyces sp. NPDC057307]|uniref:hypothetical protein n=1 Tax=Streptomyces sp. NPDC057307 TaxID=3346096 RepID=UPI003632A666